MKLLLVFTGAGIGGVLRYGIGAWIQRLAKGLFPWSTFFINVSGCFVMGGLMFLFEERGVLSEDLRLFLMVGTLGGYTTFSTYGYEAEALLRDRERKMALMYSVGSILAGIMAVWAGRLAVRSCGF
jgi:CrcB protein